MPRYHVSPALVALALSACGAPAKPTPIANAAPTSRYSLQPLYLHGGEGRHSSHQSWTTASGVLELAGTRAVLQLRRTTQTSPITCSGPGGFVGRQACAPPGSKATTTTSVTRFTGDVRDDASTSIITLRADRARLSLACTDAFLGYTCAITAQDGVFWPIGDIPSRLVFSAPPPRTYSLQPTKTTAGNDLTGALTIHPDASASIVLATPTSTVTRRASLRWASGRLVVTAGPPIARLTLGCTDHETQLTCDLTADRSILSEADHVFGEVVLVARR